MDARDEPLWLDEDDAAEIGFVRDFYELLRAIDEVMPKDAVLCLEGTSIVPEVAAFLEPRQPDELPAVKANTLWPKSRFFHLPLAGTNLSELREVAERYAEPEVADHLIVYRVRRVLLWAHDAGDGYVQLSRTLPTGTIERFRNAVSHVLKRTRGS